MKRFVVDHNGAQLQEFSATDSPTDVAETSNHLSSSASYGQSYIRRIDVVISRLCR